MVLSAVGMKSAAEGDWEEDQNGVGAGERDRDVLERRRIMEEV